MSRLEQISAGVYARMERARFLRPRIGKNDEMTVMIKKSA